MADDGKVVIELVGKDNATQTFIKSMKDMESSVKNLEASGKGLGSLGMAFDGIRQHWMALVGAIGGGYAVTQVIRDFWESFKVNVEAEKALLRMSERLGATVKDVSGLQFAAGRTGVELDTFNTSVTRMTKNISAANLGVEQSADEFGNYTSAAGKATQALRELGFVKPEQMAALNNLPLKEKLMAIAEAMKQIPSEADKVRIALDLFGKGGGGMVVMLKDGAEGIQKLIDRGTQFGVVLDKDMVQRGAAAAIALKDLKDVTHGFSLTITDLAAPAITQLVTGLNNKIIAVREADPGLQHLTRSVKDFAEGWAHPALEALKMGIVGGRIAGLQGAAIGAAAGFAGLSVSLKELGEALNNPLILAFLGGAAGSRLGTWGAVAGAAAGATLGITRGVTKDAAAYQKESAQQSIAGVNEDMPVWPQGTEAIEAQIKHQNTLDKITKLYGEGTREKSAKATGGKGGSAGMESTQRQLENFIKTMEEQTARASGDGIAALDAWYAKESLTLDELTAKTGKSRAARDALGAAYDGKREKIEEDFNLFVAKESGNAYVEIEAQAKAWLGKWGALAGAKTKITEIENRKTWLEDVKQYEARAGLEKEYLNTLASTTPILAEQFGYKERALVLEIEMGRDTLEKKLLEMEITEEQKDQYRVLRALTDQAKKYSLEREKWAGAGVGGGLQIWATDRDKESATRQSQWAIDAMKGAEQWLGETGGSAFVDYLHGKKTNLQKMFSDIGDSLLKQLWKMGTQKLFDSIGAAFADPRAGKLGTDVNPMVVRIKGAGGAAGIDLAEKKAGKIGYTMGGAGMDSWSADLKGLTTYDKILDKMYKDERKDLGGIQKLEAKYWKDLKKNATSYSKMQDEMIDKEQELFSSEYLDKYQTSFTGMTSDMSGIWQLTQNAMTMAGVSGDAQRLMSIGNMAMQGISMIQQLAKGTILADAYRAAAAAFAWMVEMIPPPFGFIAGAAAAAVTFAAISAYALFGGDTKGIASSAGGDFQVGLTGPRNVHQGETILPVWAAESWRDIVSRENTGGRPGENGGGGTVIHAPITFAPVYNYRPTQADMDRDARMMVKAINKSGGVGTRGQKLGDGRF